MLWHLVSYTAVHKRFCEDIITCTSRCSGIFSAILPYTNGSVKTLLPVPAGVLASSQLYCRTQKVLWRHYYLYQQVFWHPLSYTVVHKRFCEDIITCTSRCSGIFSAILPYTKGSVKTLLPVLAGVRASCQLYCRIQKVLWSLTHVGTPPYSFWWWQGQRDYPSVLKCLRILAHHPLEIKCRYYFRTHVRLKVKHLYFTRTTFENERPVVIRLYGLNT